MHFFNVYRTLYCDPWMIRHEVHEQLCAIAHAHADKSAHDQGGCASAFLPSSQNDEEDIATTVRRKGIAFITLDGVIGKRVGNIERSSGVMDIDRFEVELLKAEEDRAIRGILIDVDSPGGTVIGVPELAETIRLLEKPVVAFTEMQMASAALFLASGADLIVATGSAQVGSIGTFIAILDQSKQFEAQGVKVELIKSGAFKGMGFRGTTLTDQHKAHLQANVDRLSAQFTGFLSEERDIPATAMEGQTYDGLQAKENKIVDIVGNMDAALEELEELISN